MANKSCYYYHLGEKKINYDDLPCGNEDDLGHPVTCCVRGGTCMSNGLCQNAGGTGYYTADCTDPTMQSPYCLTRCVGFVGSQIAYNSTTGLWSCCSYVDGKADCSSPTDETFPAPAPSNLTTIVELPQSGTATYTFSYTTSTATSNSDSTSSNSQSRPLSPSRLSSGAIAGIGIGAAAVGLLVGAAIAFFFFRKRKAKDDQISTSNKGTGHQPILADPAGQIPVHELAHPAGPGGTHELSATGAKR